MPEEYFVTSTDRRLDRIEEKLERLIGFRWMLLGASAAVSTVFSIVVTLIFLVFKA
jgi:hypothetical protein